MDKKGAGTVPRSPLRGAISARNCKVLTVDIFGACPGERAAVETGTLGHPGNVWEVYLVKASRLPGFPGCTE